MGKCREISCFAFNFRIGLHGSRGIENNAYPSSIASSPDLQKFEQQVLTALPLLPAPLQPQPEFFGY
jgi:hypothetical protein